MQCTISLAGYKVVLLYPAWLPL